MNRVDEMGERSVYEGDEKRVIERKKRTRQFLVIAPSYQEGKQADKGLLVAAKGRRG